MCTTKKNVKCTFATQFYQHPKFYSTLCKSDWKIGTKVLALLQQSACSPMTALQQANITDDLALSQQPNSSNFILFFYFFYILLNPDRIWKDWTPVTFSVLHSLPICSWQKCKKIQIAEGRKAEQQIFSLICIVSPGINSAKDRFSL